MLSRPEPSRLGLSAWPYHVKEDTKLSARLARHARAREGIANPLTPDDAA